MKLKKIIDIDDFAYSKKSHIKHFKEFFEEKLNLLNISFHNKSTLKEYQDYLVLYFIKNLFKESSLILGIGKGSRGILNILKSEHKCFIIDNPEILFKDFNKTSENIHCESLNDPGKKLKSGYEMFDFIYSNSEFDNIQYNNPKNDFHNLIFNLNRLTRKGGLININFKLNEFNNNIYFNNLLYLLYKDIFPTHFPITKYISPFDLQNDEIILKFSKSGFESTEHNGNHEKFFISYSVLIRKYVPAINIVTDLKPGDYLKKRPAYFFHHLIKCGGSSLGVILKQWFHFHNDLYHTVENDFDYFQNLNVFQKYKFNIEYLSSDYCIRGHYQHDGIFLHQRYPEIYKMKDKIRIFTFVRDPFDLLVSLYFFSRNRNLGFENLSLKQYLKGTPNILSKIIPCTESNYKEVLDNYFFIGILEKFQESFDKLAFLTGFKKIHVPRYNVSEKDLQLNELSDEFISEIKKQNELDYKIYNYCLDKFNKL